jgi:hypothetical protein
MLYAEVDEVEEVFRLVGITTRDVQRILRGRLGQGTHIHTEAAIHRSEACKAFFRQAEYLAASGASAEVRCIHLLAAILEDPGEHIAATL